MKIYIGFEKSLHGLSCISIISCHGSGWCWKPAEGKTWLCCGQRIAGCDSLPFPRHVVEESWSVLWVWVALGGEQYLQDRLKWSASTNLRSDFSIYLGGTETELLTIHLVHVSLKWGWPLFGSITPGFEIQSLRSLIPAFRHHFSARSLVPVVGPKGFSGWVAFSPWFELVRNLMRLKQRDQHMQETWHR